MIEFIFSVLLVSVSGMGGMESSSLSQTSLLRTFPDSNLTEMTSLASVNVLNKEFSPKVIQSPDLLRSVQTAVSATDQPDTSELMRFMQTLKEKK